MSVFVTRLESEADDAPDHGTSNWLKDAEDAIRKRSNAIELTGALKARPRVCAAWVAAAETDQQS